MGRVEQSLGIGIGGAALSSVLVMVGNHHEKEARVLGSNSFFTELFETDTQTKDRLADVDSYQLWSEGTYVTAVSILFITTILVFAQLTAKKH